MLIFSDVIHDTQINISFQHKINVLLDDSGTGKTFLFRILNAYCSMNSISHVYFDYRNTGFKTETFVQESQGVQYIFLDNADLYMTANLLNRLKHEDATIIISIKNMSVVDIDDNVGVYTLYYDKNVLESAGGAV